MRIQVSDNRFIGDGEPCFVIAEAGINHNGDFEMAKQMIDVAVEAKADAVKFQKRRIPEILIRQYLDFPYDVPYSMGKTYREHKEKLEFSDEQYLELAAYAKNKGIMFLASGFDAHSFDFLDAQLNVAVHKLASPFVTHLPMLERVAKFGKPLILSTGMSTGEEVDIAVKTIKRLNDRLILLQCTTTYPTKFEDIHLRVINTFRQQYQTLVGFSGHEPGIAVTVGAVALGACVVERHFTLDRAMVGPDHAASLETGGLIKMIRDIRALETALGSERKCVTPGEVKMREKYQMSIVTKTRIPKGVTITDDMLTFKGPGKGLPPGEVQSVVGKKALKDFEEDSLILREEIA